MNIIFFFNDTATTEIYTLSLHDALPISLASPLESAIEKHAACAAAISSSGLVNPFGSSERAAQLTSRPPNADRKSTRLNSSHLVISYAVFCLTKKKDYLQRM